MICVPLTLERLLKHGTLLKSEQGYRVSIGLLVDLEHGGRIKLVEFDVKIESGGASWWVHMVANGLIFCLDVATRSLAAVEGLSNTDGVFSSNLMRKLEFTRAQSECVVNDQDFSSWGFCGC